MAIWTGTREVVAEVPDSEGYLVVDSEKCANCKVCMQACSAANEGEVNFSKSRVQVTGDPHGTMLEGSRAFPDDVRINQCRQCEDAPCVDVCPTGALHADEDTGNVRLIDQELCVGCVQCVEACPVTPDRLVWDQENRIAKKCDLCAESPYWDEEGGPDGKQACMETCPMDCFEFISRKPTQVGDEGYDVNLQRPEWQENFVAGLEGEEPPGWRE